ncbi:GNAT family N-acetyltransferase [Paenibacillus sp. CAA11]|uniref:GNAT family N-acetyltransferase n=1 Tax=Paenibacillus sp. CAA11 TaxID=1532905 RepID=UPI00131EF9D6|nr:GNAT family N-acetyltransferase [Paenibacillus sp. CAA11]
MQISSYPAGIDWPWEKLHGMLLTFVRNYGARRITAGSYRMLMRLSPQKLEQPGAALTLATVQTEDGCHLAGFSCTTEYGSELHIVVVHPLYRNQGIGRKLMTSPLETLGRLRCRVAVDNLSSLKMCFNAGFTAYGIVQGPTGKPTLLLEREYSALAADGSPRSTFAKEGERFAHTRIGNYDFISK